MEYQMEKLLSHPLCDHLYSNVIYFHDVRTKKLTYILI
jgi:hypothetical protein